ncbi:MAG TPA: hydrogenase nickel incorporation protein HypB [Polyangiaceae bacterium]|nr:hydrogenase nickel incorporation protein HypB [Polyangiaceae bacterium]
MCQDCGCGDPELVPVQVRESLLSANDRDAAHNREHFESRGIYAVNLMGSPGAGKTALLEAVAQRLGGERLRAVSGDLATDNDGARLRNAGIGALTITTGQACHLDARLVHRSLHELDWQAAEYLFIENVGNLVCPAIYDLGQAKNVVVLSVTEGEDKPLKYPVMFRVADLVILSKVDLLPHLPGISPERILENLRRVRPNPRLIAVSASSGEGVDEFADWLTRERTERLAQHPPQLQPSEHHHPAHDGGHESHHAHEHHAAQGGGSHEHHGHEHHGHNGELARPDHEHPHDHEPRHRSSHDLSHHRHGHE